MYEPVWQAVKAELSGERARDYIARIWEHARWNDFRRMRQTAAEIAAIMREIGLEEVEVQEYPADGVTAYGGWVMPEAWDVEDARLEIVEPQVSNPVLANYRDCPHSLIMYSAPTPPEGVVAEVVVVEDASKEASYEQQEIAGKIVLVDGVGLDIGLNAFERGAAGVVSDVMKLLGSQQDKGDGHFDHACQWHNYTIPPWRTDKKGFGFSISPADGRRLRELLRQHPSVRLRAVVETRLYNGVIPLVAGLLPGETQEEIVITGHLCEPGANDNSSGCGLGLEVVRTIRALCEQGKLPKLKRGIRPVFSFEVRGYQAFLASYPRLHRFVAGINLDMVGNDLSEARARSNLVYNWPALPAYTDAFALELMRRLQKDDPLFRFRTEDGALVDNLFGEPAVGAPMCVIGNWPDAYYHTSLDRIESISPRAMQHLGRVAAAYCAFLANAGFPDAAWLASLTSDFAQDEILQAGRRLRDSGQDADARLDHVVEKNVRRLKSVGRLLPTRYLHPTAGGMDKIRDSLCSWSRLFPKEELDQRIEKLADRLVAFARRQRRSVGADQRYARRTMPKARAGKGSAREQPSHAPEEERRARRLVPLRTFRGSVCFESLDEAARRELKEQTSLGVGWGAPYWLQLAMFRSNGKRAAWEIWQWLKGEGVSVELPVLNNTVEFLARHDFVKLRPVLTKGDYRAALEAVGVPRGGVLMVHSSLSEFGYVEGGPETVIDALLEALGPEGTLAMPTLSFSWVGRMPYDRQRTPSRVGAITEAFRRRPGVVRSPHPTHSIAAHGPKAEEIVSLHTPDRPVFAAEGAYGKLYELDGGILMLCKLGSNTSLHMAEERVGLLLVDFVGHVVEKGRRRELIVRHMPWHANFDRHYEALFERGLIRAAPLGEGTIHLMRVRDAIDVALENVRRDPLLATGQGCECEFCQAIRAKLGE